MRGKKGILDRGNSLCRGLELQNSMDCRCNWRMVEHEAGEVGKDRVMGGPCFGLYEIMATAYPALEDSLSH